MAMDQHTAGFSPELLLAASLILGSTLRAEPLYPVDPPDSVAYRVAESPWSEGLGGHRAVLNIESTADADRPASAVPRPHFRRRGVVRPLESDEMEMAEMEPAAAG